MKTVCKKLLCLMLVAMLLVSAVPAAFAAEGDHCKITLSPYSGSEDLSANKVTIMVEEGSIITAANVKDWAEQAWAALGYEYKSCLLGDDGTMAMPDTTIPVEVKIVEGGNNNNNDNNDNNDNNASCEHKNLVDFPSGASYKAATCGEDGVMPMECADCKAYWTTRKIPATNEHNYVNGVCSCGAKDPDYTDNTPGDLIVQAMIRVYNGSTYTEYVDFNYGSKIVLEGAAESKRTKALAESVIGKQLIDYKWQGASEDADGNVTVNLLATVLETKDDKNVYQLRVMYNRGNGNDDYKQIDIYEGEGILAAIKNAGIKPTYKDHVLVGYLNHHTGTSNSYLTIYDVAKASMANDLGVIKVYADWREKTDDDDEDYEYGEGGGLYGDDNDDPIYDVVLRIYTNGKTSSYAKKVSSSTMGKYTKDGKLTRDEVETIVQKYFKTTSDTKYYGLFTTKTWDDGDYDTDDAVYSIELDPNKTNNVYVMVKDAKAYVADSSNPKTGDSIMIAVTTMALAAAGVVSMIELKKRKMI